LRDKMRHDLLGDLALDRQKHEYREHLVLQTLMSCGRVVENEADEERCKET
jgi:hypothetical protein